MRAVPGGVPRPPYVGEMGPEHYDGSHVQSDEIIEAMRVAGRVAADSILVAAAMPSGPSMLTDPAWSDGSRPAFQQASPPLRR